MRIGKHEIEILIPKNSYIGVNEFGKLKINEGVFFSNPKKITMKDTNQDLKLVLIKNRKVTKVIDAKKNTGNYDTKDNDVIEVKPELKIKKGDIVTMKKGGLFTKYEKDFVKYLHLFKREIENKEITKNDLDNLYKQYLQDKESIPFDNLPYDETIISFFENGGKLVNDSDFYVLDEKGLSKEISNNSRIFSRVHTKQLFDTALLAVNEQGLKQLGKLFVSIINKQNNQEKQWVSINT